MGVDKAIDQWGPASKARIAKIRAKLSAEDEGQNKILTAINMLDETYLKEDYQTSLRRLVSRHDVVLSHNDCQENNILVSMGDANDVMLIDYEYGTWNPRYYDLGNYLNEMVCDNAHS